MLSVKHYFYIIVQSVACGELKHEKFPLKIGNIRVIIYYCFNKKMDTGKMAIAIYENVREVLRPEREAKIHRAFMKAWDDWESMESKALFSRFPRTRANVLHERLVDRMQEAFNDDAGAHAFFKDETMKMVFDDRLVVRTKKADKSGLGSNIATQAVFDYCEPQADLPGFPDHQKVEILYSLNKLQTGISGIAVVARDGDKKMWEYSVNGAEGGAVVVPLPPAFLLPGSSAADLVIPRKPSWRTEKSDAEK